jgi:hypothetical protein
MQPPEQMKKRILRILLMVTAGIVSSVIAWRLALMIIFWDLKLLTPVNRQPTEEDIAYIKANTAFPWPAETKYLSVSDNWFDGIFVARFVWPEAITRAHASTASMPDILSADLNKQWGQGKGDWVQITGMATGAPLGACVYVDLSSGNGLVEIQGPDKGGD